MRVIIKTFQGNDGTITLIDNNVYYNSLNFPVILILNNGDRITINNKCYEITDKNVTFDNDNIAYAKSIEYFVRECE